MTSWVKLYITSSKLIKTWGLRKCNIKPIQENIQILPKKHAQIPPFVPLETYNQFNQPDKHQSWVKKITEGYEKIILIDTGYFYRCLSKLWVLFLKNCSILSYMITLIIVIFFPNGKKEYYLLVHVVWTLN